ncbi:MAG TPA: Ig domain-containing protein [Patescibacteria group bacterium]|nr:Ig domain-containing protein [Patescibacteria group bacterium]
MKIRIWKKGVYVVLAALLMGVLSFRVAVAMPYLDVQDVGGSRVQVRVTGAPVYSAVHFYVRGNANSGTVVAHIGDTDGNGFLTTIVNLPESGGSAGKYFYVKVAGQLSQSVQTYGNSGPYWQPTNEYNKAHKYNYNKPAKRKNYARKNYNNYNKSYNPGGTFSLSRTSVSLYPGQDVAVYLNGGDARQVRVESYTDSRIASITISGNEIIVHGVNPGQTDVRLCERTSSRCVILTVVVHWQYGYPNYQYGNYSYNSSSYQWPSISTQSLPAAYEGSYYSAYISAAGDAAPFRFSVTQGSLPSGLSLSTSGQISGIPYTTGNYTESFTVTVTDNLNRTATRTFNMAVYTRNYNNCNNYNYNQNYNYNNCW